MFVGPSAFPPPTTRVHKIKSCSSRTYINPIANTAITPNFRWRDIMQMEDHGNWQTPDVGIDDCIGASYDSCDNPSLDADRIT